MPHGFHYSRVLRLVTKAADAFRVEDWPLNQIDPDGLRYVATISVRAHWFVIAVLLFELVYRPYLYFGVARYAPLSAAPPHVDRVQRVHSLPSLCPTGRSHGTGLWLSTRWTCSLFRQRRR